MLDLLAPPVRPPCISEADWGHMSRHAQERAVRTWEAGVEERAAAEAVARREAAELARAEKAERLARKAAAREQAAATRTYTVREMQAARRAYEAWVRAGKPHPLPPETRYGWRAYRRWKDRGRTGTVGSSPRAREAARLAAAGLTLAQAAAVLGVRQASLARTLYRAVADGGPTTLALLRAAQARAADR